MKKTFTTIIFCFSITVCFSQAGEWVWIKGDSIPNQLGNYGVQGVSSPINNPPALYEPCEWTDLNGNFWLFGGMDYNGYPNGDLWRYNPVTNEWTWMKGTGIASDPGNYGIQGIPSLSSYPPSTMFASASWMDNQNNLWMFGGYSVGIGNSNNLWKYNITSNEWTWMKGPGTSFDPGNYGIQGISSPNNLPPGREECAAAWADDLGDLWLFGGMVSFAVNDLWRYNIATNQWTWMKGSQPQFPVAIGIYGTLGVEDSLNTPGARFAYCHWKDSTGKLWLFAGGGNYLRNDLWRYNTISNNWTWMSGDSNSTVHSPGIYGIKCLVDSLNIPRSRWENRAAWKDKNGNFWVFGGFISNNSAANDLWMYCVALNEWVWVSGDSILNPTGNWGSLGISDSNNKPNGRAGAVGWTDQNNHLYLFGGRVYPGTTPFYNDLWKFTIDTTCGICPTTTSISENSFPTQFLISPNPTNNEISISGFKFQPNDEILLTDILGKIIFTKKITSPTLNFKIQTLNFSNGIYFLHLKTKEGFLNNKLVVQH